MRPSVAHGARAGEEEGGRLQDPDGRLPEGRHRQEGQQGRDEPADALAHPWAGQRRRGAYQIGRAHV